AAAAERWHRFANEWFVRPALDGAYPALFPVEELLPRLRARPDDLARLAVPLDFVGANVYVRTRVAAVDGGPLGIDAAPAIAPSAGDGPRTDFGWEVWPDALRDVLVWLTRAFTRDGAKPVLEVTESGCSYADGPDAEGHIRDERRIDYHRAYLEAVHRAIEAGADVRGYHAWSLLDNFEWSEGYAQRFGLAWVDFETGERTLKDSGRWYAEVAATGGFDT
ncbi:MAG: family 1 glycosylhydrolase, partial [Myxococcales bacterium]|nr:family 1 glycosylhydrolase [Myxococcales bacterium]